MNFYCPDCLKEFFIEDEEEALACPFCNSEDIEELEAVDDFVDEDLADDDLDDEDLDDDDDDLDDEDNYGDDDLDIISDDEDIDDLD